MSATAAAGEPAVEPARNGAERRLWRPSVTFLLYLFSGGLYGIWWFWVARREMDEALGREPSGGKALLEGIGQMIPLVNAYVFYRVLTDINTTRRKIIDAPQVSVWVFVIPLALTIPCIYILPELLGPALDAFNPDMREIIRAVGYATLPAQFITFGYVMGYWNEYWLEKTGEQATRRPFGPVDIVFALVAAAAVAGLIVALVASA